MTGKKMWIATQRIREHRRRGPDDRFYNDSIRESAEHRMPTLAALALRVQKDQKNVVIDTCSVDDSPLNDTEALWIRESC